MTINFIDLDKLENLPQRESISRCRIGHWSSYSWRRYYRTGHINAYTLADRIVKKYEGKSFDNAFSEFCHKIPKHIEQFIFLEKFSNRYKYRSYLADNYVDEEGNIQYYPYEKKKKKIIFTSIDYNAKGGYDSELITTAGYRLEFESKKNPEYQKLQQSKIRLINIANRRRIYKEYNMIPRNLQCEDMFGNSIKIGDNILFELNNKLNIGIIVGTEVSKVSVKYKLEDGSNREVIKKVKSKSICA